MKQTNNLRDANVVFMLFGSHLYGLNTPTSDKDFKGIYLPKHDNLLLNNYAKSYSESTGDDSSKNTSEDKDIEIYSLPRFVEMAMQGETIALDMLHCNNPLTSSPIWESLVENRKRFYSKNLKAFVGYVKQQAAKYGIKGSRLSSVRAAIDTLNVLGNSSEVARTMKLSDVWDRLYEGQYAKKVERTVPSQPDAQRFYEVNGKMYQSTNTIEYTWNQLVKMYTNYGERAKLAAENKGVDWKAVSHALRAAYQARDIYLHGDYSYPLKETEFLLDVKRGMLDYTREVAPVLEEIVEEVSILSDTSSLPKRPNREFWDNWLLDVYTEDFLKG